MTPPREGGGLTPEQVTDLHEVITDALDDMGFDSTVSSHLSKDGKKLSLVVRTEYEP